MKVRQKPCLVSLHVPGRQYPSCASKRDTLCSRTLVPILHRSTEQAYDTHHQAKSKTFTMTMLKLRFVSWISLAAVLLLTPTPVSADSELLLTGYTLEQVSSDEEPFTGNSSDFVVIHEGNHLHDPCLTYINGERFTTGSGDEGNGFVVVNDCQVVECTKWVTSDGDGSTGGKTVVYDLVPIEDDGDDDTASETEKWDVLENGSCSYVGKFFHTDEDDGDCEVNGDPGSISCTGSEKPSFSASEIVLDTADKVGISVGVLVGAALLALLLLYCCCCRRKNKDKNEKGSVATEDYDEERGVRSSQKVAKATTATAAAGAAAGGWFGAKNKKKESSKKGAVNESRKVAPRSADTKAKKSSSKGASGSSSSSSKKMNSKKRQTSTLVAVAPVQEEKKGWRSSLFGSKKDAEQAKEAPPQVQETKKAAAPVIPFKPPVEESNNQTSVEQQTTTTAKEAKSKETKKDKQASAGANKNETVEEKKTEPVDCTCCGMNSTSLEIDS